jgi:hypothetical protein
MFRHAGDDPLDRLDRGVLRVDVVGGDLAAVQDDDAVDHLEHVMDVVGDEDAGMAGVARGAHELQHALGLGHAQIVGGLVQDDQVAIATDWRSPPESELIVVVGGMSLVMPTRRSNARAASFMAA